MAVPTFQVSKVAPPLATVTASLPITPTKLPALAMVAVVLRSYSLLAEVNPLSVRPSVLIVLVVLLA